MSSLPEQKGSRSRSRSPVVIEEKASASLSPQKPGTSSTSADQDASCENANSTKPTCPICLDQYFQPIKLLCSHVFCYLCIRGVYRFGQQCPLCRKQIPFESLKNPHLLETDESEGSENEFKWFYEGKAGWWQYDDRTNAEIEDAFVEGEKRLELMIAGAVYILDLEKGIQARKDFLNRKRRIKRDLASISKKGVAGILLKRPSKKNKKNTGKKSKMNLPPQQTRVNSPEQSGTSSEDQQNIVNSQDGASSANQQQTADSPQQNKVDSLQQDEASSTQQNKADSSQQNGSNSTNMLLSHLHVINIFSGSNSWSISTSDPNVEVTIHT